MAQIQKHLYVLILAGGGGTRLWPQSRENNPKQFVKLFGGKSLFSLTVERARDLVSDDHIFVGTSAKYLHNIKSEAPFILHENIIAEPMRRDTAMAHGIGALYIYKNDPDAVIINMASDHLISPVEVFVRQMKAAAQAAYKYGYPVTVGITPRFPHSGLGHIKAYKTWAKGEKDLLLGEKFVEKPEFDLAKKYTESGKYYWNANLYVFKAKLYLDLLKKHSPKTCTMFPKLLETIGTSREKETLQTAFQMAPTISIDYAVSEKLHKFICIPSQFHWTDVGDWKEVYNNLPKDGEGNVIEGPHGVGKYIGINSKNNLLFLDKKIVATVGLEEMLIIDTPDALLICPKDEAQGVKQVVQALKENNLTDYL
jgi:mannose-1-phosphate guanylyltransferase